MTKIVREETTTVLDENGVVKKETNHKVLIFPIEPPYVKMYLQDLGNIMELTNKAKQVLTLLVRKLDYDGMITLVAATKKRMAHELKTTSQVIDNTIRILIQKNILTRISRGEFEMNPIYFARGEWRNICRRRDDFKIEITYSANGERKISSGVPQSEALSRRNAGASGAE